VDAAEASHQEPLSIASRIQERYERARAYAGPAEILDLRGNELDARHLWERAEATLTGAGRREVARRPAPGRI